MYEGEGMLTALEIHNANHVTVTRQRMKELLAAEKELSLLHAGGVDNWEWYGDCFANDEEE